jgi:outer membrane protein TolC
MRLAKILIVMLLGLPGLALGQPLPPPPEPEERWEPEQPGERRLSLDECLRLALEFNYDIQIEYYSPQIARFTLDGSYGYYDPVFDAGATHSFNSSPGGFVPDTSLQQPSSETTSENFRTGLAGNLPTGTGLSYDIGGNLSHRESDFAAGSSEEYSGTAGISLRQPLLRDGWIDAGRRQIKVNEASLRVSEEAFRQLVINTITLVENAYYNLIFARENVIVQEQALGLARRLLEENKKRVEVGAMAPLDEKQAESQVAQREADLLAARNTLSTQQNLLKNLITDNYLEWHGTEIVPAEQLEAMPVSLNLQQSWRTAMDRRPDLQQLRFDLERQNVTLRYQRNQLFPALDLVGTFGYNALNTSYGRTIDDLAAGEDERYSIGAILTIPLGNRQARNQYKTAKATLQQALLNLKRLEQNIVVEVDDAVGDARTAFERVDATRKAREYAEAAMASTISALLTA